MNNSGEDLYALQWNSHTKLIKGMFNTFRKDNELVDVTLSCEGNTLKAHKIVLSACSTYFLELFRDNPCQHPIIIMRDISYQAMVDILSFMYIGEVNVAMEHLNVFLETAEFLQVKGLSEDVPNSPELLTVNNLRSKPFRTYSAARKTNVKSSDTNKEPEGFRSEGIHSKSKSPTSFKESTESSKHSMNNSYLKSIDLRYNDAKGNYF